MNELERRIRRQLEDYRRERPERNEKRIEALSGRTAQPNRFVN